MPTKNSLYMLVILVILIIFIIILLVSLQQKQAPPQPTYKLDRIYYINLDRRKDRNQHFLKQCKKEGIDLDWVQRVRGIDGKKELHLKPNEAKMFENADFKDSPFRNNLIGNQLSHYYILEEMIVKGYNRILILQDDVVFKKGFKKHLKKVLISIPEDAEIVNIGFHQYAVFADFVPIPLEDEKNNKVACKSNVNDQICVIQDIVNPCSLAYIVTRRGAINLVQYFKKNGFLRETDYNYNVYLSGKNINYASRTVLCTGALLGSDIFT